MCCRYGFGDLHGEFWLGMEYLHQMAAYRNTSLRVELTDWDGKKGFAEYLIFYVHNETDNYTLILDGYRGDIGDSLHYHSNHSFSTPDRDNDAWDGNCAQQSAAGWWFNSCSYSALNNRYYDLPMMDDAERRKLFNGILWYHWKENYSYSMKETEMKIRPLSAQLQ